MMTTQPQARRCTVYRCRGQADELELAPTECGGAGSAPLEGSSSICAIMSRELLCARPDLEVTAAVALMIERRVGCLPVVDERRRPVGVVTKFDLVEQVDAAMRLAEAGGALPPDLAARTADEVMMPIALTLDEHATIAHAAAMMVSEDTHHVLVVGGDGALIGVVSAKDVVRWVAEGGAHVRARRAGPRR